MEKIGYQNVCFLFTVSWVSSKNWANRAENFKITVGMFLQNVCQTGVDILGLGVHIPL